MAQANRPAGGLLRLLGKPGRLAIFRLAGSRTEREALELIEPADAKERIATAQPVIEEGERSIALERHQP